MSSEKLRKSGGVGMDFDGTEGEAPYQQGSALAKEHPPHVSGENKMGQEVISKKPTTGTLGDRGVQGS